MFLSNQPGSINPKGESHAHVRSLENVHLASFRCWKLHHYGSPNALPLCGSARLESCLHQATFVSLLGFYHSLYLSDPFRWFSPSFKSLRPSHEGVQCTASRSFMGCCYNMIVQFLPFSILLDRRKFWHTVLHTYLTHAERYLRAE